ncbi:uncharacterized protein H6S33_010356 [Morchella sextelata]|uniref:uncharacterized protein n=1 Tax=Morchella sextelata TaxID=1174677 RepID=UPI001D03D0C5|nr:uncharacterized protein H6S33_010356 [Morchella sextelata]KAH0612304.1 hypothetical protein H6S33_010356 [Morchella sextelata]
MAYTYIQEPDCKGSPERRDVEFKAFDGLTLRGWFYPASSKLSKSPAIVITHGWGAAKEMNLDVVASLFQQAGLASLVYDHRNIGSSDSTLRGEINPHKQAEDYHDAISYLSSLPEVDASKIAIWGFSLAGGHCIKVAAIDKRVKAVVTIGPMISTVKILNRNMLRSTRAQVDAMLRADRENVIAGGEGATMMITSSDPAIPSFVPTEDAQEFLFGLQKTKAPKWVNKYTAQSMFHLFNYNPEGYIQAISPAPWLLLQADNDNLCAPDVVLSLFNQASEPKELSIHKGGHFTFFEKGVFEGAMETTIEFLKRKLEF